jgi:hypothetical protein
MMQELSNQAWRTYINVITTERLFNFSMHRSSRLRSLADRAYRRYTRRREMWWLALSLNCCGNWTRDSKLEDWGEKKANVKLFPFITHMGDDKTMTNILQ